MSNEEKKERRQMFRQVALKLLEIRTKDDYDVITEEEWIEKLLHEASGIGKKLYLAELYIQDPDWRYNPFAKGFIRKPPKEEK